MIIQSLTIRNFRCFDDTVLKLDGRVVVIQGPNGSGKSSLLEAMHYCCYLKSFRTNAHRDMIQSDKDHFFIALDVLQESLGAVDTINVGFSPGEGKVVTCNQKPIRSYKELVTQFKVITLTAEDIELVNGSPECRREFLNYALVLQEPGHWEVLKQYRSILDQRNQLLLQGRAHGDEFVAWSKQLWDAAQIVRQARQVYLTGLESIINGLLERHLSGGDGKDPLQMRFVYQEKGASEESFDAFWSAYQNTLDQERAWKRSLFGAHLDDFGIIFHQRRARVFASRGQQKLLALLIKVAQLLQLSAEGEQGVLLLDDFMTDFDKNRVYECFNILKELKVQIVVSTPIDTTLFFPDSDLYKLDLPF